MEEGSFYMRLPRHLAETLMMDAIANLRAKGHAVADSDLVHLSPALYAHINRYGKYHFETEAALDQQPRRPLRQPSVLKA